MGAYRNKYSHLRAGLRTAAAVYRTARAYRNNATASRKRKRDTQLYRPAKKPKRGVGPSQSNTLKTRTIQSPAAGLSFTYTPIKYKRMKGNLKNAQVDVRSGQFSGAWISDFGRQYQDSIGPKNQMGLTYDHLVDIFNASLQTQGGFSGDNQIALPVLRNNPHLQRKMWLDSYETTTIYTNQSPGTAVIYIYDLIANKTDVGKPFDSYKDGLLQAQGILPATSVDPLTWNIKPEDVALFKRSWKIKKKRRIELASGRAHQHVFKFDYNGWVSLAATNDGVGQHEVLKGITCAQFCIVHGLPTDASATATAAAEITLDRVKIIACASTKVKTRYLDTKQKVNEYSHNFAYAPSAAMIQAEDSAGTVLNNIANAVVAGVINA